MKIYSDITGVLVRVIKNDLEEQSFGPLPVYEWMLEIDPITNQHIVNHIDTDWNNTKMLAGVLTYNNLPVTINPPGIVWLAAIKEEEAEGKASAISGWATWTEQEALDWYTTNVTDLIDTIPDISALSQTAYANNARLIAAQTQNIIVAQALVIQNMARMLLALRNKSWPNLEGS